MPLRANDYQTFNKDFLDKCLIGDILSIVAEEINGGDLEKKGL